MEYDDFLSKDEYSNKLRNHPSDSLSLLDQNGMRDDQIRWEYIKLEIRKFSITFSKNLSKFLNAERKFFEKVPKEFRKMRLTLL